MAFRITSHRNYPCMIMAVILIGANYTGSGTGRYSIIGGDYAFLPPTRNVMAAALRSQRELFQIYNLQSWYNYERQ